jgi:16S rRNA processing protein RimM
VPHDWVTLARILRARGRIGEVAAEILTDFPDHLTRLSEVYLWDGTRPPRRVAVRRCWLHQDRAIFHFEGCDSISEAEKFAKLDVQVPLAERVALPEGQHYITDLIGCAVVEASARLGIVKDVQITGEAVPGAPLLVVETATGELLIPMAEEICVRIDTAARCIQVVLPEGLRDINHS